MRRERTRDRYIRASRSSGTPPLFWAQKCRAGQFVFFGYVTVYARSNWNRSAPPSVSMARNRSADEVFGVSERNIAMVLT